MLADVEQLQAFCNHYINELIDDIEAFGKKHFEQSALVRGETTPEQLVVIHAQQARILHR